MPNDKEEIKNESAETKLPEAKPEAKNGIPATTNPIFEETVETVIGKMVKLAPDRAIWKTDSKSIELNQFTGVICAKVTADLSVRDRGQIVSGLRSGSIRFTDKDESIAPMPTELYRNSTETTKARIFLDNPNQESFAKELSAIRSREFLSLCISIYEYEYRNQSRLHLLKEQLSKL